MTKIIIGKQGDQKFPIKNAGVSRQHASITIEGGHWILEDLDLSLIHISEPTRRS